jgi:bacterioferritin
MKTTKKIITTLNDILLLELTSINQYFLHARMFRNWGFNELNKKAFDKSIKDMKQADALIERILFLEGLPNLQALNKLRIGEHPEEMLGCDMALQMEQLAGLREAIVCCEAEQDFVSRDLLEDILEYEEGYVDWLESQQFLIANTSIENYLQSQIS